MLGSSEAESDAVGEDDGEAGFGALSPLHPANAMTDKRTAAGQAAPREAAWRDVRPGGVIVEARVGGAIGEQSRDAPARRPPVAAANDGNRADTNAPSVARSAAPGAPGSAYATPRRRRPAVRRTPDDFIDSPGRQDERRTTLPAS